MKQHTVLPPLQPVYFGSPMWPWPTPHAPTPAQLPPAAAHVTALASVPPSLEGMQHDDPTPPHESVESGADPTAQLDVGVTAMHCPPAVPQAFPPSG